MFWIKLSGLSILIILLFSSDCIFMYLARALGVTTSVFIIVEDAFIPPNDVVIKAWPIPDFWIYSLGVKPSRSIKFTGLLLQKAYGETL